MKAKSRQSGLTLMETTIVVSIVALLTVFSLPAAQSLFDSMVIQGDAKVVISSALANARAIAAREQRYAGIRFQQTYPPIDPLNASQYMTFIIHDPAMGAWFFRAVEGTEPIKLPDDIGVMDLTIANGRNEQNPVNSGAIRLDDRSVITVSQADGLIDNYFELTDATAFSIIFSPSGKLVIHGIRVRNKHDFSDATNLNISSDDIFNKIAQVDAAIGMFYQDDYWGSALNAYPNLGLGQELSRSSFVIYNREEFRQVYQLSQGYSGYLYKLVPIYINPYTGTMISTD